MLNISFISPITLIQAAIAGIIFGFLLQKGNVTRFNTIVNQFLLKDFTMLKIMLTAIIVGGIGAHIMAYFAVIPPLNTGDNTILRVLLGGMLMGIGIPILGYCPGTCAAAAGQGSTGAKYGLLGMLLGTMFYAEVFPFLKKHLFGVAPIKFKFLPNLFSIPSWIFFLGLIIILFVIERITKKQ